MADKQKDMEMRMDKMETRLKATFLEIERKFEEAKIDQPFVRGIAERMQELEDLLLLLQLEITKLKEKTGADLDFGTTPTPQRDMDERLRKLEEVGPVTYEATGDTSEPSGLDEKVGNLESVVEELKDTMQRSHLDYKNASSLTNELDNIEKRLARLEAARPAPQAQGQPRQRVLEDVRRILES